jgi:hypothetical protein
MKESPLSDVGTIAAALDISKRRVQQLTKEGVLTRAAKGKYDLAACICQYQNYYASNKVVETDGIKSAKLRLLTAQADKAELELNSLSEKYVSAEELEFEWSSLVLAFRAKMLSMPSKLAMILAGASEPAKAHKILEDEIYDALTELSKYGNASKNKGEYASNTENSKKDSPAIKATS